MTGRKAGSAATAPDTLPGAAPLRNARHEQFCHRIVEGRNITQAAAEAGFSAHTAAQAGSRLLKKVQIQQRIERLKERATSAVIEKVSVSRAWVIEKLVENVERAMQAEPVLDREGNETGEYVYQGAVANQGLALIGKDIGMFVDRVPIGSLEDLTDAELEQVARGERPARLRVMK